ncbi:hypothetical protein ACIA8O_39445 [Kitasatospora sp. NPDC051853]|uniref:hypothetical protein n=1 Tax=Kitasatospora sp. NPDC051853 TaxID=3364058 RepID=UPI0037A2367E
MQNWGTHLRIRSLGHLARLGLALALAVGTAGLGAAAAHAAQPITSGTMTIVGEPEDWLTGGRSYSFSTAEQASMHLLSDEAERHVRINVSSGQEWWSLDLAAPQGQKLVPGTYTDAARYPFNEPGKPGLSLGGRGGCNSLTGSFTVTNAVFGPYGYLETLDASFEQHCEGAVAAARGEVHIRNLPASPVLDLALGVAVDGTASALNGNATVHGQVTCNKAVPVTVSGRITQVKNNVIIRGGYHTTVPCTPGTPASWTGTAVPEGTTPFQRGRVEVIGYAGATDPDYDEYTSTTRTVAVQLTRVRG